MANKPINFTQLKNKYKDEQVFVIPFADAKHISDKFTRIKGEEDSIWTRYSSSGKYIMRYDAEYNPIFQQLIPYVLIQNGDKFYVTKRIAGESRLKDSLSLGFGGHINPCDGTKDPVFRGMVRELMEEVYVEPTTKATFVGYTRNMTSELNDHIGLVFLLQVSQASIRETDSLEGIWMTIDELEKDYFKFEGWARFIIDYLSTNKSF